MKIGRNALCPCGSGKKYKNCCLDKKTGSKMFQMALGTLFVLIIVVGLVFAFGGFRSHESSPGVGKVWSEEHQHWH